MGKVTQLNIKTELIQKYKKLLEDQEKRKIIDADIETAIEFDIEQILIRYGKI